GLKTYRERFIAAMDDDFNTADALAVLFDLARETNTYLKSPAPARSVVEATLALFEETGAVLGFFREKGQEDAAFANKVNTLLEQRQAARKAKDWAAADAIRDELAAMGVIVEDTPQGPRWRKK
ncbi:MAG TPA: cysteine--tRNA ligase, partial [Firmicutes bacterium]|nr:cysteine--tRNA ligase [Bacillota bacterium]